MDMRSIAQIPHDTLKLWTHFWSESKNKSSGHEELTV